MLDSIPIRWRLALISASLTFVILLGFAIAVGQLTVNRIRSDFNNEVAAAVADLSDRLHFTAAQGEAVLHDPDLNTYGAPGHAQIRILTLAGRILDQTKNAPNFGIPPALGRSDHVGPYRVETRTRAVPLRGSPRPFTVSVVVQYARKVSDIESTVHRVRFFLVLGVIGGTLLALIAGLLLSRRAMKPIAGLTATARDIARTRDPGKQVPEPRADDEVAELARTLNDMLQALEASQLETEDMLKRQRQFVADASHELRTPLTSVLANLELLADVLDGEKGEAANSALRSSKRMRRLVADLLLLARADAKRVTAHEPTDVGQVLVDVAAELEPVANGRHHIHVDAEPVLVDGARDELHRMALNLVENALRHTPDGTHVRVAVHPQDGQVVLTVEDDGPGVPTELRDKVFERFVRGSGDRGATSSGLGLSIVRAVAESHGGKVALEDVQLGARFVVRLPRLQEHEASQPEAALSA